MRQWQHSPSIAFALTFTNNFNKTEYVIVLKHGVLPEDFLFSDMNKLDIYQN